MTNSEYIKRSVDMIKTEWFPNHVASPTRYARLIFTGTVSPELRFLAGNIDALQWANPTTSTYLVMYFLHRSTLFVTGDIGHAIYRWGGDPNMSLSWIAKCNYSYFAEKLEGVDRGDERMHWDSHVLELRAAEFFKSYRQGPVSAWREFSHSRDDWQRFLWENVEKLGYDQAAEASELGLVPNNRVIGHWLGLRLALGIEQPAQPLNSSTAQPP